MEPAQLGEISRTSLFAKLEREMLSPQEVADGARECFIVTQQAFITRRSPHLSLEDAAQISNELVLEVYKQEHIEPETASPALLRYVIDILNGRFEFSQDPELFKMHNDVINQLFAKLVGNISKPSKP
jgi:hypothetical protein